jgi:arylsulfatase A-like enzyme
MNVIFIVVDTLRASRMGCYGYPKPTSPTMDRLAAEGVRFERAFAPGIPTTPAHTTMFTGMHPLSHNIVCHGGAADLDRRIPVLPELLQRAGYTTAAVDNLFNIKPWLARGYEFYINPASRHRLKLLVSCEEINSRAIPWIQSHAKEKFFLFLHYWEPHTPYLPPERYRTFYPSDRDPFSPDHTNFEPIKRQPFWEMFHDTWFSKLGPVTDAEYIASLYDAEIRHVDDGIAQILDTLNASGLTDDTMVILTGDHGESMYQHDIYFDHHGLYDDVVHVPLVMRLPGRIPEGTTVRPMVQHLDLAQTILEAASAKAPAAMEGKSLWPLATGEAHDGGYDRVVCCESTWQSKWALRTEHHKLIVAREQDHHNMPPRELYDLKNDPDETCNLALEKWELTATMEAELEEWICAGLARHGRTDDPLRVQGITLGKRWSRC